MQILLKSYIISVLLCMSNMMKISIQVLEEY